MPKNNIVIFFTDQQRWDTLGVNGNPMGITPNLDRAAADGTNCKHAYSPQPVCLPARACLQTGFYASQIDCNNNKDTLKDEVPKIASYFNQAGYHTGYIGKWHLKGTQSIVFDKPQGEYQYWLAENILEFETDAYDTSLHDGEGKKVTLPGYRVDALTDAAIRYIDDHREEPFMLMLSHLEPHHQNHRDSFPPPYGYEELYNDPWTPPDLKTLGGSAHRHLPGYYGMVKRLDEACGRVLDVLRSRGILDNTVVLFTSDHGCHFKTRNAKYKRSCHDSSIRIPMVLTGGPFTGGGQLDQMINLVDMPPTLLDAAGIEVPDHMMGNSILSLLNGGKKTAKGEDWPEEIYSEISETHTGRCVRTRRWKYSARKTGDNLYVDDFLYDTENDPWELDNLAGLGTYKEVIQVMRKRLFKYMRKTGQSIPQVEDAPPVDPEQRKIGEGEQYA